MKFSIDISVRRTMELTISANPLSAYFQQRKAVTYIHEKYGFILSFFLYIGQLDLILFIFCSVFIIRSELCLKYELPMPPQSASPQSWLSPCFLHEH